MLSVKSGFEGDISLVGACKVIFHPYGEYAFVFNYGAPEFSVIDTVTGRIIRTERCPSRALYGVFSQDGLFAYLNLETGQTREVNTHVLSSFQRIYAPAPSGVLLTKNGPRPYMTALNTLYEVDLSGGRIVRSLAVNGIRDSLAVSAARHEIYAVTDRSFVIVNLSQWTVKSVAIAEGASLMAFYPGRALAYISNTQLKGVQVLDLAGERIVAFIPIGGDIVDIALTPNGVYAFALVNEGAEMCVIDTAGFKVVDRVFIGGGVRNVAVTLDGSRVYVTNEMFVRVFRVDRWAA